MVWMYINREDSQKAAPTSASERKAMIEGK